MRTSHQPNNVYTDIYTRTYTDSDTDNKYYSCESKYYSVRHDPGKAYKAKPHDRKYYSVRQEPGKTYKSKLHKNTHCHRHIEPLCKKKKCDLPHPVTVTLKEITN